MKKILQRILEKTLRNYSEKILKKYNPDIIGITGSVGKTSTKEAISLVLSKKFDVRKNIKNYNNELGIPLTIIDSETGGKSFIQWQRVFQKARGIIQEDVKYPEILVLEMGADHPGDIEYLTWFIKCKIGIITTIGQAHIEFFETIHNIAKEKGKLIESLPNDGYAILNIDDERVYAMRNKTKAKVLTYGFSEYADFRALDVRIGREVQNGLGNGFGTSFKLKYHNSIIPIALPHILGGQFVYSALCAIAVGTTRSIPLIDIAHALQEFHPSLGRMNMIDGIKTTKIIDDTYNSSPQSVSAALKTLASVAGKRKIAVLGDMLEFGSSSEKEHKAAGKHIPEFGINILITVGERARDFARGAESAGMSKDYIFSFGSTSDAGRFLQDRIASGDTILIKGSQGMRMEKIVKEIMAEPLRAGELLARQDKEWLERP